MYHCHDSFGVPYLKKKSMYDVNLPPPFPMEIRNGLKAPPWPARAGHAALVDALPWRKMNGLGSEEKIIPRKR